MKIKGSEHSHTKEQKMFRERQGSDNKIKEPSSNRVCYLLYI